MSEREIRRLRYDLDTMREDRDEHFAGLVKCAERITELTADRDRWMSNAHGARALSLEYLRERDRYREIVQEAATFPCRAPDPPCSAHSPEHWCMTCRASFALNREE